MERFGPYQLVRRLATGGMAEVFLARQLGIEGFEREVVIKRILPHRAQDQEFSTMFLDEARLIARLNHPNVAQIYDLGRVNDAYYIVMEYVPGVDLSNILDLATREKTEGLPLEVSLPIGAALCEALGYIHSRTDELGHPLNIVHRDLNPKNVIISYDGAVKLIDFGIAKAASQVYETRTGVIKGTYGYMAPEQVSRQKPIDLRADLFALGVLLYEITTGQHPFDAPDEVAVLGRVVRCNFVKPSRVVRGYPRELEKIVLSCMHQDPVRRPAKAREILARIEEFSLSLKISLTMTHIAEYVQSKDPSADARALRQGGGVEDELPASLLGERLSPSGDRRSRTLPKGPKEFGDVVSGKGGRPRPSGASVPSASVTLSLPWANWGTRERRFALMATMVAVVVCGISGILLFSLFGFSRASRGEQVSLDEGVTSGDEGLGGAGENPGSGEGDAAWARAGIREEADRVLLRVESEPPRAKILLEGKATGQLTPAEVSVPNGQRLVWLRVELPGYVAAERQVHTGAGAALFTLNPVSDGGSDPIEDPTSPP